MYYKGRKVRIVGGLMKGRNAVIVQRIRQQNRVLYKLRINGISYPMVIKSGHIRVGWYKR